MSDSFADLWNSSTPSSKPGKATLGSLSSSKSSNSLFSNSSSNLSGGRQNHSNDLFSQLSASGSSSNTPRTGSRVGTPALGGGYGQPQPKRTESSGSGGGGDAFGDLFNSSGTSSSSKNMTMAQRAAQAEKERREKLIAEQAAKKKQDAAWVGLDFLGSGNSSSQAPPPPAKAGGFEDDWDFGTSATTQSTKNASTPTPVPNDDDWGLDDFASAPPTTQSTSKPSSSSTSIPKKVETKAQSQGSLWDLDGFGEGNATGASSRIDSPSRDFDWGNREDGDGLLGHGQEGGQDDILGDLGKPVRSRPETPQRPASSQSTRVSRKRPTSRTSSPPPHILGQLVEMGFSITQAKAALAATDSGEDVQAALDFLISNGAAGGGDDGSRRSRRSSPDEDDRGRNSDEPPELPRRPNIRRQASDRGQPEPDRASTTSPRSMRERERVGMQSTQSNITEHADKILAQASTIGMSLFSRANAAWKDVQKVAGEKVQKVYEERRGASERQRSIGAGAGADGRPKWWREESGGDEDDGPSQRPPRMPPRPREREGERERFADDEEEPQTDKRRGHANGRPRPQPELEPEVDLFSSPAPEPVRPTTSESTPGAYVSPFRHGRPKPRPTGSSGSGGASMSRQAAASPQQRPEPHPTTLVLASPVALRTSSAHRAKGASFFKLGDFPAAEGEYTKAIECLPSGQTVLITLFNNRALVRLKVGNSTGAIEDAGKVVELVGSGTGTVRGGVEGGETGGLDGVELDVNLGGAILKAWKRRAEAFEGREKWEEAGKDWERVAGAEWAGQGARGEGVRGAGRCRRMLNQQTNPEPPKSRPPPPRVRPKVTTPTPSNSEALKNLREANIAAENEDAEKHVLKDSVDSKLLAWKGGKETNIRALLASLEMVLWPELGVPKWGMHELISEGQVKVKYMKAIAKVHPDKLSAGTFTVEQKMLAQGVFGTLNEAWNAFKQ